MSQHYRNAGVDVEAGDSLVDWLKQTTPRHMPHADKQISGIGGFAALFRADFSHMAKPTLVSCTDGVGTKVKLASHFEDYSTVGQDLVAMCVNDLVCCGGRPLFFLDYYATGKLELPAAKAFLHSVRSACIESDCLLIGGETAEMPGVYQEKDFDCAGFAVGVVDEEKTWGAHRVKTGDAIMAVASSGFHSNGFSLLRRVFADDLAAWRDVLLTPTRLYPKFTRQCEDILGVRAVAHITGGGMDNLPRVLPDGYEAVLNSWEFPKEFIEVQKRTGMSQLEMLATLNCGVGLAVVLAPEDQHKIESIGRDLGWKVWTLGKVEKKSTNTEASWRLV